MQEIVNTVTGRISILRAMLHEMAHFLYKPAINTILVANHSVLQSMFPQNFFQ